MDIQQNNNLLSNALAKAKSVYILPREDVAQDVISPAFMTSKRISIMMGFFSSASFGEIAPGLAIYLRQSNEPLRLIISPFISNKDQDALRLGIENPKNLGEAIFSELLPNANELSTHTLTCLAWLIAKGRLEIKIAIMRNALFHSKVWLFENDNSKAVLHGSANMTGNGLRKNREQLCLAKNWQSDEGVETYEVLATEFDTLWSGGDDDCLTIPLPNALRDKIIKDFKGELEPKEEDFDRLWRKANGLKEEMPTINELLETETSRSFTIPNWLNYQTGDYSHQGEAIIAWQDQKYRGILEMCTGSGKTLTAMVGAHHLFEEQGSILIVVAAPYNVLIKQWCQEITLFGIRPTDMSNCSGPRERSRKISDLRRRLRKGATTAEAIVVSNSTLCSKEFIDQISRYNGPKLFIADECHNLGAENFINNPPECFDFRLGLSATPIRQYDEEGTDALFEYFGEPCFSYNLEQAIGKCLTPYDYHVTFVEFQPEEMEEWREISAKIAKLSWKIQAGEKDGHLESLFLQRRRILETAESKLDALNDLLDEEDVRAIKYCLIYATDKDPEQLKSVNSLLRQKGILYHQLTAEETANPKKSSQILERFQSGALQILTAKRVLDEGVNIPQIMKAYILASTTVKRQWVQRRGRLLRTCKEIGKKYAVIHDIVALPPEALSGDHIDKDAKKIINAELDRVWEFARLSRNGAENNGPFEAVEKLRSLVGG